MSCKGEKIHPVTKGDTGAAFEDHLMLDGESVDLAGASVGAYMQAKDGTQLIENGTVAILQTGDDQDQTEPNVRFTPETGDLNALGIHSFKWKVTLSGGGIVWFPRGKPHLVEVHDNLE